MVQKSNEYATCRWNHCDSSRGKNLSFGLMYLKIFLHIGNRIIDVSTDKTNPAPRDIQTENVSVFRPDSLGSSCCFFLSSCQHRSTNSRKTPYHPRMNSPTWNPWNRMLKNNFDAVNWLTIKAPSPILPVFLLSSNLMY